MKPLDPLTTPAEESELEPSAIQRLLREAPTVEVRAELERLDCLTLSGSEAAARDYAIGALALREGRLDAAESALGAAEDGFRQAGEAEPAALAACERWLAPKASLT